MGRKPGMGGEIIVRTNTTMEQRKTWMCFLLFGISAFLLITGCGKSTSEYVLEIDLQYQNVTDSTLSFEIAKGQSGAFETVILPPQSSGGPFSYHLDGDFVNPTPDNCCLGFVENNFKLSEANYITVNDSLCVLHNQEKSAILSNYESEIISDRHFRYTYTFKSDDLAGAAPCQ